jgi:hypothetical protein
MQNFIKYFVRESDGHWRCVAPADLDLPEGRVRVAPGTVLIKGTRFMNVDVGALLEEEYQRQGGRLQ